MVIPSNLYNPKNFVMAFYFMWYGVAPLFASRYASLVDGDNNVVLAYKEQGDFLYGLVTQMMLFLADEVVGFYIYYLSMPHC